MTAVILIAADLIRQYTAAEDRSPPLTPVDQATNKKAKAIIHMAEIETAVWELPTIIVTESPREAQVIVGTSDSAIIQVAKKTPYEEYTIGKKEYEEQAKRVQQNRIHNEIRDADLLTKNMVKALRAELSDFVLKLDSKTAGQSDFTNALKTLVVARKNLPKDGEIRSRAVDLSRLFQQRYNEIDNLNLISNTENLDNSTDSGEESDDPIKADTVTSINERISSEATLLLQQLNLAMQP